MRKYLLGVAVFFLAFGILTISVLRSASVRYAFSAPIPKATSSPQPIDSPKIDYELPYPGGILPDNPLWPLKAFRDRLWYTLTANVSKKSEISLLFANKRLAMAVKLFERGKADLAFSTLTKSQKYLEMSLNDEKEAESKGQNTTDILIQIGMASLKHREVLKDLITKAPEDAAPGIIRMENYSKNTYTTVKEALNSRGVQLPISPFPGD